MQSRLQSLFVISEIVFDLSTRCMQMLMFSIAVLVAILLGDAC